MLDRPIGFHDEEIVRGERHGWHLWDRVLAEAHRVERVSAERARRGVVRNGNHLPALRALELGQFLFHRLKPRSEEHTSELQSHSDLVCRLLLEKKKKKKIINI